MLDKIMDKDMITSLELLEQINFFRNQEGTPNTNHKDLMIIIETEFTDINRKRVKGGVCPETYTLIKEQLQQENIKIGEYEHSQNKQIYPMYILPLSKAKQCLLKESKYVRKAVIHYIEDLEIKLKIISVKSTTENQKTNIEKNKRLEIMEKNANVRLSKQFSKLAEMTGNARYKEVLIAKSANVVAGEEILPLPKLEQKSYSAAELGAILGISANMVGRIANKHSLKTDRYGYLAQDKSRYSNKEVESFRYYEHSIEEFKKHLKSELI